MDSEFEVVTKSGAHPGAPVERALFCRKQRDREESMPIGFALHPVDIGDGESSCVVVPRGLGAAKDFQRPPLKPGAANAIALEALHEALVMHGEEVPTMGGPACHRDRWRDAYGKRVEHQPESWQDIFRRARRELTEAGYVSCVGKYCGVLP